MRQLSDIFGTQSWQLPASTANVFITALECLMDSASVRGIERRCRAHADLRVLAIDGQFSTLMNVVYQVPHGATEPQDHGRSTSDVRVFHTMRSYDSTLLVVPKSGEIFEKLCSLGHCTPVVYGHCTHMQNNLGITPSVRWGFAPQYCMNIAPICKERTHDRWGIAPQQCLGIAPTQNESGHRTL